MRRRLPDVLYVAVVACFCLFSCQSDLESESRPNFILIMTDELELADIGAYGGSWPTPNIDALAKEGIQLMRAYCPASMCTPARYSLLTGQYPGRCKDTSFLRSNPTDQPYNIAWNTWITQAESTLPEQLQDAGYFTGISGKWHLGALAPDVSLPELGAEANLDAPEVDQKLELLQSIYAAHIRKTGGFDMAESIVWSNFDNHPVHALRFHNFPWITRGAVRFLEAAAVKEQPFFLYLTPTAIHGPNHVADLEKDKTYTPEGRQPDVLEYQMDEVSLKENLVELSLGRSHRYVGIRQIDYQLGLVRSRLAQLGLSDNTYIIFLADHNIEPGKATPYEKGTHIPMIIAGPAIQGGGQSFSLVSSVDIFPTILNLAGINADTQFADGVSMKPVLEAPESQTRSVVYAEAGYTRSISDGRYKYIALRYPQPLIKDMQSGALGHAPSFVRTWPQAHSAIAMHGFPHYFDQDQFYDLQEDPYEQENIYGSVPDRQQALKAALQQQLKTFRHQFDLTPDTFLQSNAYRRLTEVNRAYDLGNIPWLRRDHDFLTWPPVSR